MSEKWTPDKVYNKFCERWNEHVIELGTNTLIGMYNDHYGFDVCEYDYEKLDDLIITIPGDKEPKYFAVDELEEWVQETGEHSAANVFSLCNFVSPKDHEQFDKDYEIMSRLASY